MILETLKTKGKQGWLLDGFPRNLVQVLPPSLHPALISMQFPFPFCLDAIFFPHIGNEPTLGRNIISEKY